MQKYSVNQKSVDKLLHYIKDGDIVIPEIQRPFVWESVKVRDLMDSLYKGFPVGYIITWKNPNIRLKNGNFSNEKQVLIDGQQRITALMAAILGQEIVDENYKKKRIFIAFHPLEEKFETLTPAIKKSSEWISDISQYLKSDVDIFDFVDNYFKINNFNNNEQKKVKESLKKLSAIKSKDVGIVELDAKLDIEDVTEIFIRINSAGVELGQADFAMSKIASYEPISNELFGVNLRKLIDYFAHLVQVPHFYNDIKTNDLEFGKTEYIKNIEWLKKEHIDLYIPDYKDILRVAFVKEFKRGKISDLVKLLSGQNFETRSFDEEIQKDSFLKLEKGVLDFINENHFKNFLIIIQSTGIINSKLINSKNILNFAYIVYLHLRNIGMDNNLIKKYTRKWLILSILTERYSGSPEFQMDKDIKDISEKGIVKVIEEIEAADLSNTYWKVGLVQDLKKATISNPFLKLFFAAQIYFKDKALFSDKITVQSLIEIKGDIHHIFPKKYLQKAGKGRGEYNQIANFAYLQQEINIKIGAKPPKEYFGEILEQTKTKNPKYGLIVDEKELMENLKNNAIPGDIFDMDINDYQTFLEKRRVLMAEKIEKFYKSL